jgi:predicted nucleic acid-binding protein
VALRKAILDANVLLPAVLRDTLLRAADADLYEPYWSAAILDEVRRNLVADLSIPDDQASRLIAVLRRKFPRADVVDYEHLIDSLTNHPSDRHVLAAAIIGGARTIVTNNLRHFTIDALLLHGISPQSPDDFLVDLLDAGPVQMHQIIREQAEDLRRPRMSVDDVVGRLAKHAPTFAEQLRRQMT